jgi:hypothetical protein
VARNRVLGGVRVMSDKRVKGPFTFLVSLGGVLLVLWIVTAYDPEGMSAQSVSQQHAARVQ